MKVKPPTLVGRSSRTPSPPSIRLAEVDRDCCSTQASSPIVRICSDTNADQPLRDLAPVPRHLELVPPPPGLPQPTNSRHAAGVPVPPPPLPVHALDVSLFPSVGSVGHPHACREACRYIKRKGGCRNGANCTMCHLCFWRRPGDKDGAPEFPDEAPISEGTRGHPHHCSAPCRYVRRRGGCRDGTACKQCHACVWQREQREQPESPPSESRAFASTDASTDAEGTEVFGETSRALRALLTNFLAGQLAEDSQVSRATRSASEERPQSPGRVQHRRAISS